MLATQTKKFGSDCKWFFKIRIICTLEVIFYATIENKDYFCGRSETINVPHCLPWWAGCRAPCRGLSPASCTWARRSSRWARTAGPVACPAPWRSRGDRGPGRQQSAPASAHPGGQSWKISTSSLYILAGYLRYLFWSTVAKLKPWLRIRCDPVLFVWNLSQI